MNLSRASLANPGADNGSRMYLVRTISTTKGGPIERTRSDSAGTLRGNPTAASRHTDDMEAIGQTRLAGRDVLLRTDSAAIVVDSSSEDSVYTFGLGTL